MSSARELWLKGLPENTSKIYGYYFDRLLALDNSGLTPEALLKSCKKNFDVYLRLKNVAKQLTEHGRMMAVAALRSFLLDGGIENLPAAHMKAPRKVKPSAYMTWEQASAICGAASKPYNLVFNLMRHCGWGISEFLKFNTAENWRLVKKYFEMHPNAPYFRFNYAGRKRNENEFYSLIPRALLQEIMSVTSVPIMHRSRYGKDLPLDMLTYRASKAYLGSAFETALKRAPVIVQGKPTPHELRDTFRTRATHVNAAREAAEFVMGHTVDPLSYDKCFRNEAWVWSEINKITSVEDPDQRRKAEILQNMQMLGRPESEIAEVRRMIGAAVPISRIIEYVQNAAKTRPSATDGGKAYDALLVEENDLVHYLEMGWELVSVINSKVAIRRPSH
jgi:integrase